MMPPGLTAILRMRKFERAHACVRGLQRRNYGTVFALTNERKRTAQYRRDIGFFSGKPTYKLNHAGKDGFSCHRCDKKSSYWAH